MEAWIPTQDYWIAQIPQYSVNIPPSNVALDLKKQSQTETPTYYVQWADKRGVRINTKMR